MKRKKCNGCQNLKDFCEFHKGNDKYGLQYKCKDCKKKYAKLNLNSENNRKKNWAINNSEKVRDAKHKYYKNNKTKELKRNNQYIKKMKKDNLVFKLSCLCRTRLNEYLKIKKITKKNKTFDYVGCHPHFLKEYLEKKFVDGMCWENHGEWHIDHIIPLSFANNEQEVYQLFHYTNLQPLWAKDNLTKGSKIITN